MAVKLGIEVAGGVVAERRGHGFLALCAHHLSQDGIAQAGFSGVSLHPGERALHGPVVRPDNPLVPADQTHQRYGLRG